MIYDCIVIGAGAAGLMAAVELEKNNLNYILLEKMERVGKKLLITGGKRCNVTNNSDIDAFINSLTLKNKRFLYPSLYNYGPNDVIDFFKENDLELVLENNFKYFPITNRSSSIIDVLVKNIAKNRIITNATVKTIEKNENLFKIKVNDKMYTSKNIIIATGSQSFPTTGSSGDGIKLAEKFNIRFNVFTPAETHVYSKEIVNKFSDLQAVSLSNTTVSIIGTKVKCSGDLLFTHFGLSGPAIYHLSENIYEELKKGNDTIKFNLVNKSEEEIRKLFIQENIFILKVLEGITSKRLAKKILTHNNILNKKVFEISKKELSKIITTLLEFTVKIDRVEDKEKAYVNKGGILLNELNPRSMECKKVEGLYFVGETVNIHGPIGGFNITIAFSMGKLAAQAIAEKFK